MSLLCYANRQDKKNSQERGSSKFVSASKATNKSRTMALNPNPTVEQVSQTLQHSNNRSEMRIFDLSTSALRVRCWTGNEANDERKLSEAADDWIMWISLRSSAAYLGGDS